MKRYLPHLAIIIIAVTVLLGYYYVSYLSWIKKEGYQRAEIARMLALLQYSDDECEARLVSDPVYTPATDLQTEEWYTKYVNIALLQNWMVVGEDGQFNPGAKLTYNDLITIMDAFCISKELVELSLEQKQRDGVVSCSQWCEIFDCIIIDYGKVKKTVIQIEDTVTTDSELGPWQVKTSIGVLDAEGLNVDRFLDKNVEAYCTDTALLCIKRIVDDDKIDGTEADSKAAEKNNAQIRILLSSNENEIYVQPKLTITSDEDFYKKEHSSVTKYKAGEIVNIYPEDFRFQKSEPISFMSFKDEGKLTVLSLNRSGHSPAYHGTIEAHAWGNDMILVNQVEIEDYVAGVIPGEMPISYGEEALKAQAVCARTFAFRALGQSFQGYPANLDDSVLSQVYNAKPECRESLEASLMTVGEVLQNKKGLVRTYFFSTSCGHTSAPEDVWYSGTEDENQEEKCTTVFLSKDQVILDLTKEVEFRRFINLEGNEDYFEKDLPWFRWCVYLNAEDIEQSLSSVVNENPGRIEDIEIGERADSGVIKSLNIFAENGRYTVCGEYRIRKVLSPVNAELINQYDECVTGWSMLPSAYCYIDPRIDSGYCQGFMIHGGGYGHGCGMSQNGAMKMAEQGKTYEEILQYFFPDAQLLNLYKE